MCPLPDLNRHILAYHANTLPTELGQVLQLIMGLAIACCPFMSACAASDVAAARGACLRQHTLRQQCC